MANIQKKPNGSYKITVSMGYDYKGDKIRKTTTFKPDESKLTKKTPAAREKELLEQVEKFAHDFEEQCKAGKTFEAEKTSLKTFAEQWLDEVAAGKLQPTTFEMYKMEIEKKIIPAIGHKKLSDLKPAVINSFYFSMTKDGSRLDGRKGHYSKGSIQKTAAVLSSVLATAEQWEIIDRNPCSKAKVPTVVNESEEKKLKYFTPEQTASFLEFLEHPGNFTRKAFDQKRRNGNIIHIEEHEEGREIPLKNRVLLNLALNTGARKGELVALQWSDIDFEKQTVSINKTAEKLNGSEIVKKPKTESSIRTVMISGSMVKMLKELKAEQAAYKLKVRDYYTEENWVFTRDNGQRMSYNTPYDTLQCAIRRYNATHEEQLPMIPFHGLRHTSATGLITSGMDVRTVADRLGHSSTDITLNVYSHSFEGKDKEAAEVLESIFTAKKKQA